MSEMLNCEMSPSTLFVRSSAPLTSRIDDEVVMLDAERGHYYGLGATGSVIWDHLAEPRSFDEVCRLLTHRYAVTDETCRAEAAAFLASLRDAGLVRVVASGGVAGR